MSGRQLVERGVTDCEVGLRNTRAFAVCRQADLL